MRDNPGILIGRQNRTKTILEWTTDNTLLADGELGIVSDIPGSPFKFGDGITKWNSLKFVNQYPNYLISYPGTRQKILSGELLNCPEYTVSNYGINTAGYLLVHFNNFRVYERKRGDATACAISINNIYTNGYEQVGTVGTKSSFIKATFDIPSSMKIEIQWCQPE